MAGETEFVAGRAVASDFIRGFACRVGEFGVRAYGKEGGDDGGEGGRGGEVKEGRGMGVS